MESNEPKAVTDEIRLQAIVLLKLPPLPIQLRPGQWTLGNPLSIEEARDYFEIGARSLATSMYKIEQMSADGMMATFTPYVGEVQLFQVIASIDASIIALIGDTCAVTDFSALRSRVWNKCGKILVEEEEISFIRQSPAKFYRFWSRHTPRSQDSLTINESKSAAETRYRQMVEMMNEDLSIADIAKRLGVTRSAVYLMRSQYKEQLKLDVDRGMRAMQFRKRED